MELSQINKIHKELDQDKFTVLAIDVGGSPQRSADHLSKNSYSFPFAMNDAEAPKLFNAYAAPVTYLLDQTGKVVYRHVGYSMGDEVMLKEEILELLK